MKATGILLAALCLSLCLADDAHAEIGAGSARKRPTKVRPANRRSPTRAAPPKSTSKSPGSPIPSPSLITSKPTSTAPRWKCAATSPIAKCASRRLDRPGLFLLPVADAMKETPSLLVKPGSSRPSSFRARHRHRLRSPCPSNISNSRSSAAATARSSCWGRSTASRKRCW